MFVRKLKGYRSTGSLDVSSSYVTAGETHALYTLAFKPMEISGFQAYIPAYIKLSRLIPHGWLSVLICSVSSGPYTSNFSKRR